MPVDDHPVHPKTIRSDGTLWGCNNAERKSGYWAPDGYKTGQLEGCFTKAVVLPVMRWIADTSSTNCHSEIRADDPACKGCEKLLT